MLKKIVGAFAAVAVMICALGMGYPQKMETQAASVSESDSNEAIVDLVSQMDVSQDDGNITQTQGTEAISQLAEGEAMIQDFAVPLVENIMEESKRKTTLTPEEINLLCKVVSAESRGESQYAQYSVACVILNRMESQMFPNTLEEVISQAGQFSCVPNGAIHRVPITDSVVEAVANAMDNNTLDPNVMWFRSGFYHPFHQKAYQDGKMFFSKI